MGCCGNLQFIMLQKNVVGWPACRHRYHLSKTILISSFKLMVWSLFPSITYQSHQSGTVTPFAECLATDVSQQRKLHYHAWERLYLNIPISGQRIIRIRKYILFCSSCNLDALHLSCTLPMKATIEEECGWKWSWDGLNLTILMTTLKYTVFRAYQNKINWIYQRSRCTQRSCVPVGVVRLHSCSLNCEDCGG